MDSKPTILVTEPLSDRAMAHLRGMARSSSRPPRASPAHRAGRRLVLDLHPGAESLLEQAGRLKVVGRAGVALDNIDVPACRARGVEVVHTPAANTLAVVDYTIGMIVQLNRRYWPMTGP